MAKRKIRMGIVGGGPGSFIGRVHYMAAVLDGQIELVCGSFSSDYEKSKITGREYYLSPDRIYRTYQEMIVKESNLAEGERMELLCIVTPNHLHFEPAKLALENGINVVCDKPLALDSDEAEVLARITEESGLLFALTHAYTGYPMVKEAREMIMRKELGEIRKIVSEYPQGWLTEPIEKKGHVQASWRIDPERSGRSSSLGDIGTHAFHLAEYITGLKVTGLFAELTTFVAGRILEDDANLLLRFTNGARGILYASQISAGEENGLKIRIYGEKGGLEWIQTEPSTLTIKWHNRPVEVRCAGSGYLGNLAKYNTRLPAGHPEGLIEAFANIYRNIAICLQCREDGISPPAEALDFPDVYDGLRGMYFIDRAIESFGTGSWVSI